MKISRTLTKICGAFFVVAILFVSAGIARAQTDSVKKKRLPNPAVVKGFIGGESHDSYVIRARTNQTIRVQISWLGRGASTAQFSISKSTDFFSSEMLEGKESDNGKTWVGKAPVTGDYYIYVTAHPTAKYTLKVTVK